MHRDLRELLHSAVAESRFVIAVYVDVRGFSSFAKLAESSEAALFLKTVYTKILDDYFPQVAFFKPTGDGLLLVVEYSEVDLAKHVQNVVATAIKLVEDFPTLCADVDMINFKVPTAIGVGISRGAATLMTANSKTLDLSGRPLNLGARLLDMARPSGVVIDAGIGVQLLEDDLRKLFVADNVFVRGLAEQESMQVLRTQDVQIPQTALRPLGKPKWHREAVKVLTLEKLKERLPAFHYNLTKDPISDDFVDIVVRHDNVRKDGSTNAELECVHNFRASIANSAWGLRAKINFANVIKSLEEEGVNDDWKVKVDIHYRVE